MSKFESAINNFGSHVTSGLSNLVADVYGWCETSNVWTINIDLLNDNENIDEGIESVSNTKEKFIEIVENTSGVGAGDIDKANITIDYHCGQQRTNDKKKRMREINVWYGYDPNYTIVITVILKDGHSVERKLVKDDD